MNETNILDSLSIIEETINIAPVEQEERVTESSNSILSEEDEELEVKENVDDAAANCPTSAISINE